MQGHCEVIVSLTSHEQKEAISPTGAVEQMRQFRRLPDQCSLYGARKASRCDLKGPKFREFYALHADGRRLRSLCIDILACHDEKIRAIAVIRLNLNPPFQKRSVWRSGRFFFFLEPLVLGCSEDTELIL